MNILAPVDGSAYTQRMLAYLASHGLLDGGHAVTFLHVVAPLPHRAAAFAGPDAVHRYYEDDARSVLDPVRDIMKSRPAAARFVHEVGHPGHVIARTAEQGAFDLVVMGSHGHGLIANLVLGSVATQVLAGCRTPVLLIR